MEKPQSKNAFIIVSDDGDAGSSMAFELQPIAFADSVDPYGFELLLRGARDRSWLEVDQGVLRHLHHTSARYPLLFVNLANESLLSIPAAEFVQAARQHNLVFELSEMQSDRSSFEQIVTTVNSLIDQGVRFAVDDFGAGRDGLQRVYSLKQVAAVKIDGDFLLKCMDRPDAASTLKVLTAQWRAAGVDVVAECVEADAVLQFAQAMGINLVQGWHVDALYGSAEQAA